MNALMAKLAPLVRHTLRLSRTQEHIELELRIRLESPLVFFALVQRIAALDTLDSWFSSVDELYVPNVARPGEPPLRAIHDSQSPDGVSIGPIVFAMVKRKLLQEQVCVRLSSGLSVRIDVSREHYRKTWDFERDQPELLDALLESRILHRNKQRCSFVLRAAPAWQIDATRVATPPEPTSDDAQISYELEIELVDTKHTTDTRLLAQLRVLFDTLKIR